MLTRILMIILLFWYVLGGLSTLFRYATTTSSSSTTIQCVRCGPCLLMAPEFEEAAKDLSGKVRFVKLDTDLEPDMAARLGIMGLPTLLFLDKNDDTEAVNEGKAPVAVLKERIEGALRKESIKDLCDYHFFDGPMPTQLS